MENKIIKFKNQSINIKKEINEIIIIIKATIERRTVMVRTTTILKIKLTTVQVVLAMKQKKVKISLIDQYLLMRIITATIIIINLPLKIIMRRRFKSQIFKSLNLYLHISNSNNNRELMIHRKIIINTMMKMKMNMKKASLTLNGCIVDAIYLVARATNLIGVSFLLSLRNSTS